jgi:SAM-dependent methyltransferase
MPLTDDLRIRPCDGNTFLHDIDVYKCNQCDVSQTVIEIDFSDYYLDYSYTVAASSFATTFMKKLAQTTLEFVGLPEGLRVIEVGSGDGQQLSYFKELGAKVFGFEPSSELCSRSENIGIPVYQGLFNEDSINHIPEEYLSTNILLLTYTFDHLPAPVSFLESAKKILDPVDGLLVIEVHDLDKIVERREYCLFEHEHFTYLNALTMQGLLERSGFKLITLDLLSEKERRGNSLLVVAALSGSKYDNHGLREMRSEPIDYPNINFEILNGIRRLDEFVELNVSKGKKIAGFGAGGRGVMTLAAMNSANNILYICDNNSKFHEKYTPKSNITVKPPVHLQEEPVDILLVFSFGYIGEIREQITNLVKTPIQIISILDIL